MMSSNMGDPQFLRMFPGNIFYHWGPVPPRGPFRSAYGGTSNVQSSGKGCVGFLALLRKG